MVNFSPLKILGRWQSGFALDYHTISSVPIGYDEFGHLRFDTTRTPIGELLYRLKNGSDTSVVPELVENAAHFVNQWRPGVSALVPIPPSNPNRAVQPVVLVGKPLAERLGLEWVPDAITKVKATPQLKNVADLDERVALLTGAFSTDQEKLKGKAVLLFDDLYRSGATMNSVAETLYDQAQVSAVYALTLTRTRVNR